MGARIPENQQRIYTISSDIQSLESTGITPAPLKSRGRLLYPCLVLVVGLLCYIPWLGSYGLLDPTDSFFLESGRELIETNKFLLPINNYEPWLDKPILFFWMVALSFKTFGITPFAGRLPAALSAVACALLIYGGCRPILKRPTAAIAALIFLACPLSSIIGRVCLTDMTLCALITGTILFLFKGLQLKSNKDLLIGYFCAALAFLCKGPIAIIICGMALLPYIISVSQSLGSFAQNVWALRPLIGILIILVLNLPWYIMAEIESGRKFWLAFFYTQNFGRMVGTVNHQGPFYFYIPVFFGGFFPWCTLSLSAPGIFKKTLAKKQMEPSSYRRLLRLCVFWFVTMIVLFSTIKTKLPTYILPALPAFAIMIAMQIQLLARTGKSRRLLIPTAITSVAFIVGIGIHPLLKGYVKDIIAQNLWITAPIAVSLVFCWLGLIKNNSRLYAGALLSCALLCCGVMVPRGMQAFYKAKQIGFNELVCVARDNKASVAMVFAEEPSVPWIIHRPVSRLMNEKDAATYLKNTPAPHYVLVQTALLERLDWFPGTKHTPIGEKGKWHLIQVEAN